MSTPAKPRGGTSSELTRCKILWRDSLDEAQRDYWRSRFVSSATQAAIRSELKEKLEINFTRDDQVKEMRDWDIAQRKLDLEAEQQADDERRLKQEHGDWSKEQVREEVIRRAYNRSLTSGDFQLGFAAMKQDRGFMDASLAQTRLLMESDEFFAKVLAKAEEMSQSGLSNAEKIASLRQIYFADVEALQRSGSVQLPS